MKDCLVGKTIINAKIANDDKAILFVTDHGEIVAKADGDCCSSSWIEHVELPALGFPAKVIEVLDIEMPNAAGAADNEDDLLQIYGLKISTDKGDFVIDYRNESNGYYGGNLSWPGDHHYGGVYGQNDSTCEWVGING